PTAAAVAEALYRFDGVRRTRLPMRDSAAARAAVPRLASIEASVDRAAGHERPAGTRGSARAATGAGRTP
ncbi:MAG TPA: hypothetical protein VFX65_14280, partial [Candidatus Limnocylindrales bacterium]|nr:hypothetical protein [Candidatus Limnocylindrales bacterium]